jgi:hypothetical protein
VDVLVGARGAITEAESLGVVLRAGVSTPLGLAGVEAASVAGDPVATAAVVAWLTAPVVVARLATVVFAVVAGAGAVVAGACVVAACLGGATPGGTYPPFTGWYRQPSAPPATGWYEAGPTLE